jgi:hypothetical protein
LTEVFKITYISASRLDTFIAPFSDRFVALILSTKKSQSKGPDAQLRILKSINHKARLNKRKHNNHRTLLLIKVPNKEPRLTLSSTLALVYWINS